MHFTDLLMDKRRENKLSKLAEFATILGTQPRFFPRCVLLTTMFRHVHVQAYVCLCVHLGDQRMHVY